MLFRMAHIVPMIGLKFGHLTVLRFDSVRNRREYFYACRCDCGNETVVRGQTLRSGRAISCRCVHGIRIDKPITSEQLRKVLRYEKRTGKWWWLVATRKNKAGDQAGTLNPATGYVQIGLGGRIYNLHVLAWVYVTGRWPEQEIDHRDLDRANTKWRNLRPATRQQNCVNSPKRRSNTSGYKGVSHYRGGKFKAYFRGKHIGVYDDVISAAQAYDLEATRQFGSFARTNFGAQ